MSLGWYTSFRAEGRCPCTNHEQPRFDSTARITRHQHHDLKHPSKLERRPFPRTRSVGETMSAPGLSGTCSTKGCPCSPGLDCCYNYSRLHISTLSPSSPARPALHQASPPRLVVLDMGLNFVDDDAVEVISRGLETNHVLTNLVLQGNGIGEKVRCAHTDAENTGDGHREKADRYTESRQATPSG